MGIPIKDSIQESLGKVRDSLLNAYYRLEDKWFGLLDWFEDHGIPVYKIVDPLEQRGIPSLPVFGALAVILIILIWVFLLGGSFFGLFGGGGGGGGAYPISFQVVDTNANAIAGADITITQGTELTGGGQTNDMGVFELALLEGVYDVSVTATNCNTKTSTISVSKDLAKVQTITLTCTGASFSSKDVDLCFEPEGVGEVMVDVIKSGVPSERIECAGEAKCAFIADSDKSYRFETDRYETSVAYSAETLYGYSDDGTCVQMDEKPVLVPTESSSVTVVLMQDNETYVPDQRVLLVNPSDDDGIIASKYTGGSGSYLGKAFFDLEVGTSFRIIIPSGNSSNFYRGNLTYNVTSEPLTITILLDKGVPTLIQTRELAGGVQNPLSNVLVTLYKTVQPIDAVVTTGYTQAPAGELLLSLVKDEKYRGAFFKEGYKYAEANIVGGWMNNTVVMEKIAAEEVGGIDVYVVLAGTNIPVPDATLTIKNKNTSKKLGYGSPITNEDGYAAFDWLLPGDYCIIASRDKGGASECMDVTVIADERTELTIELEPYTYKLKVTVLHSDNTPVWDADITLINQLDRSVIDSGKTARDGHITFMDIAEAKTVQATLDYKENNIPYRQISEPVFMNKDQEITIVLTMLQTKVTYLGVRGAEMLAPLQDIQLQSGDLIKDNALLTAGKNYYFVFALGMPNLQGERWDSITFDVQDVEGYIEFYEAEKFYGMEITGDFPATSETITISGDYDNQDSTVQIAVPARVKEVFSGDIMHSLKFKAEWKKADVDTKDPARDWYDTNQFMMRGGFYERYPPDDGDGDGTTGPARFGVAKYIIEDGIYLNPKTYSTDVGKTIILGMDVTNEANEKFAGVIKLFDEFGDVDFKSAEVWREIGGTEEIVDDRYFELTTDTLTVQSSLYTNLDHGDTLKVHVTAETRNPVQRTSIKASADELDLGAFAFTINGALDAMIDVNPDTLLDLTPSITIKAAETDYVGGKAVAGRTLPIRDGTVDLGTCAIDLRKPSKYVTQSGYVYTITFDKTCYLTASKTVSFRIDGDNFKDTINTVSDVLSCVSIPSQLTPIEATPQIECPVKIDFSSDSDPGYAVPKPSCAFGEIVSLNVQPRPECIAQGGEVEALKASDVSFTPGSLTADNCGEDGALCEKGLKADKKTVWLKYTEFATAKKSVGLNVKINAHSKINTDLKAAYGSLAIGANIMPKECVDIPDATTLGELTVLPLVDCPIEFNYITSGVSRYESTGICTTANPAKISLRIKDECKAALLTNEFGDIDPATDVTVTPTDSLASVSYVSTKSFKFLYSAAISEDKTMKIKVNIETVDPKNIYAVEIPVRISPRSCFTVPTDLAPPVSVEQQVECGVKFESSDAPAGYSDSYNYLDGCTLQNPAIVNFEKETYCPANIQIEKVDANRITVAYEDGTTCTDCVVGAIAGQQAMASVKYDATLPTGELEKRFVMKIPVIIKYTDQIKPEYVIDVPFVVKREIEDTGEDGRAPYINIRIQEYNAENDYDCDYKYCNADQIMQYIADNTNELTTAMTQLDFRMVAVSVTANELLDALKAVASDNSWSNKDDVTANALIMTSASFATWVPPTSASYFIINSDPLKAPRWGLNTVSVERRAKNGVTHTFLTFEPVGTQASTTAKEVQLFMPASKVAPASFPKLNSYLRVEGSDVSNTAAVVTNLATILKNQWNLGSYTTSSDYSGDMIAEVCKLPATTTTACTKLFDQAGKYDVSAIYIDSVGNVRFAANDEAKLNSLIDALAKSVDGEYTLDYVDTARGGYLTPKVSGSGGDGGTAGQIYFVDCTGFAGNCLTSGGAPTEYVGKIKKLLGTMNGVPQTIWSTYVISEVPQDGYPNVVLAACDGLEGCNDNYFVKSKFRDRFGKYFDLPSSGIYWIAEETSLLSRQMHILVGPDESTLKNLIDEVNGDYFGNDFGESLLASKTIVFGFDGVYGIKTPVKIGDKLSAMRSSSSHDIIKVDSTIYVSSTPMNKIRAYTDDGGGISDIVKSSDIGYTRLSAGVYYMVTKDSIYDVLNIKALTPEAYTCTPECFAEGANPDSSVNQTTSVHDSDSGFSGEQDCGDWVRAGGTFDKHCTSDQLCVFDDDGRIGKCCPKTYPCYEKIGDDKKCSNYDCSYEGPCLYTTGTCKFDCKFTLATNAAATAAGCTDPQTENCFDCNLQKKGSCGCCPPGYGYDATYGMCTQSAFITSQSSEVTYVDPKEPTSAMIKVDHEGLDDCGTTGLFETATNYCPESNLVCVDSGSRTCCPSDHPFYIDGKCYKASA